MHATASPASARDRASAPQVAAQTRAWPWLLGHALLFLGLYQLGYTPAEWAEIRPRVAQQGNLGVAAAYRTVGAFGLLRAYYRTGDDERMYREFAELTLRGEADYAYLTHKRGSTVTVPPDVRPWPYRDVVLEYPPFALLLCMLPPALLGSTYVSYRFWLAAYLLAIHLLNLWMASALIVGPEARSSARRDTWRRLLAPSLAFCFCLGGLVATRMDGVVTALMLATVLGVERSLVARGQSALHWAALAGLCAGVGVMTKIVPVLAIPAAVIAYWLSRRTDRVPLIAAHAGIAVLFVGAVHFACVGLLGDRYLDAYRYHAARGLQLETTYSGLLMIAHAFGSPLRVVSGYGSANLTSALADACAKASPLLFTLLASACLLSALRARACHLASLLGALLCAFVLTNKVFSPQYLLWLAPFAWIAMVREGSRAGTAMLLAAALSQVLYPRAYQALQDFAPGMVLVLNLRNALVVCLFAMLARSALRPTAAPAAAPVREGPRPVYDPSRAPLPADAKD
jgi:hypothetical protein